MKKCRNCFEIKNINQFYKTAHGAQGVARQCKQCVKRKILEKYRRDPSKRIVQMRQYRKTNIEKLRDYDRIRYALEPEKRLNHFRKWRLSNPEKLKFLLKNWAQQNKGAKYAIGAQRRASKLRATPKWLTAEQQFFIAKLYQNCPEGHHVDHIIPLKNKKHMRITCTVESAISACN